MTKLIKKIRLPIIFRKTMEERLSRKDDVIKCLKVNHHKEKEELSKELDRFIPKLFGITFHRDYQFDKYVIRIGFESSWIRDCFIHGNSQFMIEHLSHRLAHEIERELKTINFSSIK